VNQAVVIRRSSPFGRQPSSLPRVAWLVVVMLWVVALLNYLDRQVITTMATPIKADLAISDGGFGLLSSTFLWVYGALSPLAAMSPTASVGGESSLAACWCGRQSPGSLGTHTRSSRCSPPGP